MELTYLPGLKESMKEKLKSLPNLLTLSAANLKAVLSNRDQRFERVVESCLIEACYDQGLSSRVEFQLNLPGNSAAAYLGDSFLSHYLAKHCYRAKLPPKRYQEERTKMTQKTALARFYSLFFGSVQVLVTWESFLNSVPPSDHQKAEFIEAILGVLVINGYTIQAEVFCQMIIEQ